MSTESSSSLWGWSTAALTVLAAGGTGYWFFIERMWFGFTMLSVALPAVALITWFQQRRRGDDAGRAADQMLLPFALTQIFLSIFLESIRERDQARDAVCLQQIEAISQTPPAQGLRGSPHAPSLERTHDAGSAMGH